MDTGSKTRVAILEDHQSIIDGDLFRLSPYPDIAVVATATSAEELEPLLARSKPDVLLLDVSVPTSPENPSHFPINQVIPKWLQAYPQLSILVISMHNVPTLVRTVMKAGASGYILKDDQASIQELGGILRSIANGGVYLSKEASSHLQTRTDEESLLTARQLQALSMCAAYPDATTYDLADKLGVAHSTLRNFLSEAYLRLEVHNRTAAIARARQLGLISPQESTWDAQDRDV